MVYRKRVYVTIVTIRNKAYKLFVTSTLKKIADKIRLLYDHEIDVESIDESENAPAIIYQKRKGAYSFEIHKLVCV